MVEPKVAIVGGGVSGLATAIALKKHNIKSIVYEKSPEQPKHGLSFFLKEEGMHALEQLGVMNEIKSKIICYKKVISKNINGEILDNRPISPHYLVSRYDLIETLLDLVSTSNVRFNIKNIMLKTNKHKDRYSLIIDNAIINPEYIIAADGMNSSLRKAIFPTMSTYHPPIGEILSWSSAELFEKESQKSIRKIQDHHTGYTVAWAKQKNGLILWYLRYYKKDTDLKFTNEDSYKFFLKSILSDWPEPIPTLLNTTQFKYSHNWQISMLKSPLDSYIYKNLALIGDAAHTLPTLLSSGVTNALEDALAISKVINSVDKGVSTLAQNHLMRVKHIHKMYKVAKDEINKFLVESKITLT